MPELFTMYKKCGKEIKVNQDSLSTAIALGWTDKQNTVKLTKGQHHGNGRNASK